MSITKTNYAIHWPEIDPVDSAIHLSNNWGQYCKFTHWITCINIRIRYVSMQSAGMMFVSNDPVNYEKQIKHHIVTEGLGTASSILMPYTFIDLV